MAVITIGSSWSNGDQLTPAALNAKWTSATFASGAVDGTTTALSGGAIIVKDLGIDTAQLAADAVTRAKIADDQINSEHYVDESIENAHLAAGSVAGSGTGATGTNVIEANSIGHDDINNDFISGQTELSEAPNDADELLLSDGGTIKKIGIDNLMKHPAIPKAYGFVDVSTDTVTGYKVTSATHGTATTTTIVLGVTMDSTNYAVVCTNQTDTQGDDEIVINVTGKTTTGFVVETVNDDVDFSFVVFGSLA